MFFSKLFLFVGVAVCVTDVFGKIPDYIQICKRSDPNAEKCVLNSIEALKPHLKNGIPELDIPALEPLTFAQVGSTTNGFSAVGRNVKVYGTSNFNVKKLKLDLSQENRPVFHMVLNLPRLDFTGDYEISAKVLVVPIQGKGTVKFDATNTVADAVLYGQVYKKGTRNYMRFIRMDLSLKIDDYNLHLDDLFRGDKLLAEATNQALNENKKEFMQTLNPFITKAVSEMALQIGNNITKSTSYDELFPK